MQINSDIEYDNFDFYHMIEKYYKKIEKPYYPYITMSKFIDYINDGTLELSNFLINENKDNHILKELINIGEVRYNFNLIDQKDNLDEKLIKLDNLIKSIPDNLNINEEMNLFKSKSYILCFPFMYYLSYRDYNNKNILVKYNKILTKLFPILQTKIPYIKNKSKKRIKIGFIGDKFIYNGAFTSVFRDRSEIIKRLDSNIFEKILIIDSVIDINTFNPLYKKLYNELIECVDSVKYIKISFIESVITLFKNLNLDILVFTDIGMSSNSVICGNMRLAPIQINTWGHSITSGIENIDYFFSSKLYELDDLNDAQNNYSEKLVALESLCTYYRHFNITEVDYNTLKLDKDKKYIFCGQTIFKLTKEFLNTVKKIISELDENYEIIFHGGNASPDFKQNIINNIKNVKFIESCNLNIFINYIKKSEIILDTYPFGGCNSSLEAFMMNKIIITRPSDKLPGRFTYGFYKKMGILDAVVNSEEEYIEKALFYLKNPKEKEEMELRINEKKNVLFEDKDSVKEWQDKLIELYKEKIDEDFNAPNYSISETGISETGISISETGISETSINQNNFLSNGDNVYNSDKYVLCRPLNGINDMFCNIIICLDYCIKYNRTLLLDTRVNNEDSMNFNFAKYFRFKKLKAQVICDTIKVKQILDSKKYSVYKGLDNFITDDYRLVWGGNDKYGNIFCDKLTGEEVRFDFNKNYEEDILVYYQGGSNGLGKYLFNYLVLGDELIAEVMFRYKKTPKPYKSIYIRGTDFPFKYDYVELYENNKNFINEDNVFLATDSKKARDFMIEKNPNIINFTNYPLEKYRNLHHSNINTDIKIIDLVSDLFLLGLSQKLITHSEKSGFFQIIKYLFENKKIIFDCLKLNPSINKNIPLNISINFLTFSGGNEYYKNAGIKLLKNCNGMGLFTNITLTNENYLKKDEDFWNLHNDFINKNTRGYGLWIWKPFIIKKMMNDMNNGDILMYLDSDYAFDYDKKDRIVDFFKYVQDDLIIGSVPQFDKDSKWYSVEHRWNKMDLVEKLDMNKPEYMDTLQRDAGTIMFLVCEKTRKFVDEWYELSCDYHLIDNSPSILKNHIEFREHRHDQSIFSLLYKKHNMFSNYSLCEFIKDI